MMHELGEAYGAATILENVRHKDPIVYTTNGNRASDSASILRKLEALMPLMGVARVAEISELAFHNFPVFQSSRPNIFTHSMAGQNSGAQGKGETLDQAKISCLMETLEHYCSEPKNSGFVRGAFDFLKMQHVVADPRSFIHNEGVKKATLKEPLMWTEACWLEMKSKVLIPAEAVFFPFFANDYDTRSLFPLSSNGMAAGSTYLEAVIHGLYEVIERHYQSLWGMRKFQMEALYEDEVDCLDIRALKEELTSEFQLRLFVSRLPQKSQKARLKNIPVVTCCLVDRHGTSYIGFGCSGNVDVSLMRAISEALQTIATINSGSREDVQDANELPLSDPKAERPIKSPFKSPYPQAPTLHVADFRKRVFDRVFKDLQEEYQFLIQWVHKAGFQNILVANLTRKGLELPVVRVVVPGMIPPLQYRFECQWTSTDVQRLRYHY